MMEAAALSHSDLCNCVTVVDAQETAGRTSVSVSDDEMLRAGMNELYGLAWRESVCVVRA
jgi:hypothetical protein